MITSQTINTEIEDTRRLGLEIGRIASKINMLESRDEIQQEALHGIQNGLNLGLKRGSVEIPSRVGKSRLIAYIVQASLEAGLRPIIFAPTNFGLEQLKKEIEAICPNCSIGMIGGGKKEFDKQVTLSTYSSGVIYQKEGSLDLSTYQISLADESQESLTSHRLSLYNSYDGIVIPISATLSYGGEKVVDKITANKFYELSIVDAAKKGALADFRSYLVVTGIDISKIGVNLFGYKAKELGRQLKTEVAMRVAFNVYKKICNGERGIGFCVTNEHSKSCAEYFTKHGVPADFIVGKDPEHDDKLKKLASGEILVLFSSLLLTRSADIPEVSAVINICPSASPVRVKQRAPRCITKDPNNEDKFGKIIELIYTDKRWAVNQVFFHEIARVISSRHGELTLYAPKNTSTLRNTKLTTQDKKDKSPKNGEIIFDLDKIAEITDERNFQYIIKRERPNNRQFLKFIRLIRESEYYSPELSLEEVLEKIPETSIRFYALKADINIIPSLEEIKEFHNKVEVEALLESHFEIPIDFEAAKRLLLEKISSRQLKASIEDVTSVTGMFAVFKDVCLDAQAAKFIVPAFVASIKQHIELFLDSVGEISESDRLNLFDNLKDIIYDEFLNNKFIIAGEIFKKMGNTFLDYKNEVQSRSRYSLDSVSYSHRMSSLFNRDSYKAAIDYGSMEDADLIRSLLSGRSKSEITGDSPELTKRVKVAIDRFKYKYKLNQLLEMIDNPKLFGSDPGVFLHKLFGPQFVLKIFSDKDERSLQIAAELISLWNPEKRSFTNYEKVISLLSNFSDIPAIVIREMKSLKKEHLDRVDFQSVLDERLAVLLKEFSREDILESGFFLHSLKKSTGKSLLFKTCMEATFSNSWTQDTLELISIFPGEAFLETAGATVDISKVEELSRTYNQEQGMVVNAELTFSMLSKISPASHSLRKIIDKMIFNGEDYTKIKTAVATSIRDEFVGNGDDYALSTGVYTRIGQSITLSKISGIFIDRYINSHFEGKKNLGSVSFLFGQSHVDSIFNKGDTLDDLVEYDQKKSSYKELIRLYKLPLYLQNMERERIIKEILLHIQAISSHAQIFIDDMQKLLDASLSKAAIISYLEIVTSGKFNRIDEHAAAHSGLFEQSQILGSQQVRYILSNFANFLFERSVSVSVSSKRNPKEGLVSDEFIECVKEHISTDEFISLHDFYQKRQTDALYIEHMLELLSGITPEVSSIFAHIEDLAIRQRSVSSIKDVLSEDSFIESYDHKILYASGIYRKIGTGKNNVEFSELGDSIIESLSVKHSTLDSSVRSMFTHMTSTEFMSFIYDQQKSTDETTKSVLSICKLYNKKKNIFTDFSHVIAELTHISPEVASVFTKLLDESMLKPCYLNALTSTVYRNLRSKYSSLDLERSGFTKKSIRGGKTSIMAEALIRTAMLEKFGYLNKVKVDNILKNKFGNLFFEKIVSSADLALFKSLALACHTKDLKNGLEFLRVILNYNNKAVDIVKDLESYCQRNFYLETSSVDQKSNNSVTVNSNNLRTYLISKIENDTPELDEETLLTGLFYNYDSLRINLTKFGFLVLDYIISCHQNNVGVLSDLYSKERQTDIQEENGDIQQPSYNVSDLYSKERQADIQKENRNTQQPTYHLTDLEGEGDNYLGDEDNY